MNKADLLIATLRQTVALKAGAKGGLKGGVHAKDGKEKPDHFREQIRLFAKEPKAAVPRVSGSAAETKPADVTPRLDVASVLAELTGAAPQEPEGKDDEGAEGDEASTSSSSSSSPHWRNPEAALSAMVSKLDRVQTPQAEGREETPRTSVATPDVKAAETPLDSAADGLNMATAGSPEADISPAPRFAVNVEATDIKPLATVTAVVREQETHFEPVQQVTMLQKIVDRMASDLPAAASPEAARASDAPVPDTGKTADSRPLRMMTLQLDPPNLGSVTVKMRLAGDFVEIHVTADRYETTQVLRQERGALTEAMQSVGYRFDIASIDHTGHPDSHPSHDQPQQQAPTDQRSSPQSSAHSQTNGNASGRSTGDPQGGTRQDRQNHEQESKSPERQKQQNSGLARSGAVYL